MKQRAPGLSGTNALLGTNAFIPLSMKELTDNVAVTGNAALGGDVSVGGDCRVAGTLRVTGHLEAPNVLDAMKGLFPSLAALRSAWPFPPDGAMALVGDSLPAMLYRASRRRWESTGKKAGDIVLEVTEGGQAIAMEREARVQAVREEREARETADRQEAVARENADTALSARLDAVEEKCGDIAVASDSVRDARLREFGALAAAYRRGRSGGVWHDRLLLLHVGETGHDDAAMEEVYAAARLAGVRAVLHSGGFGDPGESVTAVAALRDHLAAVETLNPGGEIPTLAVPGVRDMAARASFADFRDTLAGKWSAGISRGDGVGLCCFYDIPDSSGGGALLRVVCIDDRVDSRPVSQLSAAAVVRTQGVVAWLIDTLDDAASKGIPVLTLSHAGWGDASGHDIRDAPLAPGADLRWSHSPFLLPRIIDAMTRRVDIDRTFSVTGDIPGAASIYVNRRCSLMEKPLRMVAHLFDHNRALWHGTCRSVKSEGAFDMLMVGAEPLTPVLPESDYSSVGRIRGTLSEVAFTLLCVDTVEGAIYIVPYGAWCDGDPSKPRVIRYQYEGNSL